MAKQEIEIPEGGCPYRKVCRFYDLPQKVNFGDDGWRHIRMLKDRYRKEMCDSTTFPASTGAVHGSMGAEETEYCQMYSILSKLDEMKQTLPGLLEDKLESAKHPFFR